MSSTEKDRLIAWKILTALSESSFSDEMEDYRDAIQSDPELNLTKFDVNRLYNLSVISNLLKPPPKKALFYKGREIIKPDYSYIYDGCKIQQENKKHTEQGIQVDLPTETKTEPVNYVVHCTGDVCVLKPREEIEDVQNTSGNLSTHKEVNTHGDMNTHEHMNTYGHMNTHEDVNTDEHVNTFHQEMNTPNAVGNDEVESPPPKEVDAIQEESQVQEVVNEIVQQTVQTPEIHTPFPVEQEDVSDVESNTELEENFTDKILDNMRNSKYYNLLKNEHYDIVKAYADRLKEHEISIDSIKLYCYKDPRAPSQTRVSLICDEFLEDKLRSSGFRKTKNGWVFSKMVY